MQKCSLISFPTAWDEVLSKSLKVVVRKLVWGSTVYNIWRYRNNVKFGNRLFAAEQILQNICWEVSTRIVGKG